MNIDLSAATWKKVVRVFGYAFVGMYGGSNLVGVIAGSQPLDTSVLRAAGAAGLVAVCALVWNAVIDPSPIPSLRPEAPAE